MYAQFTSLDDLIRTFSRVNGPLPTAIRNIDKDAWDVTLNGVTQKECEQCAQDVGVEVKFGPHRAGSEIYLRDVLKIPWENLPNGGVGFRSWYESAIGEAVEHRFLLAAAPGGSQSLLDALTGFVTPDIRACPVHFSAASGKPSIECLWSINSPPSPTLTLGRRAWWHAGGQLWCEWPFVPVLPLELLHRIEWGAGPGGFVLLGKNSPHVITMHGAEFTEPFIALHETCALNTGQTARSIAVSSNPRKSLKLTVNLRFLNRPDPELTAKTRLEQLRRDLVDLERKTEEKKLDLKSLQSNFSDVIIGTDDEFEPLYLYRVKEGQIPYELERLLIEWVNDDLGLASVYCAKVPARDIYDNAAEDEVVYVLTTASALLGRDAVNSQTSAQDVDDLTPPDEYNRLTGLGLRLREYRPLAAEANSFSLLRPWTEYGLRLFVPHHQYRPQLELYPQLPACPLAAEKLGKALLGSRQANEFCVLLMSGSRDAILARLLPLPAQNAGFRPLVEAFSWDCSLNIQEPREVQLKTLRERASVALGQVAKDAVSQVEQKIVESTKDFLKTACEKLIKDLNASDQTKSRIEARRRAVGNSLSTMEKQVSTLETALKDAQAALRPDVFELKDQVNQAVSDANKAIQHLSKATETLQNALRDAQSALPQIESAIADQVNPVVANAGEVARVRDRLSVLNASLTKAQNALKGL